jgi:VIT1/CCC1 family predicted Fe2+/Mn2+ transporter
VGAAVGSFLSFGLGAFVPVLPFLFSAGNLVLVISAALTALVLFAVGASLSLFTGRSPLVSGLRMLALASVAASVTYGIGRLVGVSTGI